MKFTKMHGIGNDYVYVDCFRENVADPSSLSIAVSDRHFGIGSDGLILIKPSDRADVEMDIYNADGSRAMMCGNGIRCVAKYAYDHGIVNRPSLTVDTQSGVKSIRLDIRDEKALGATVDMGTPLQTSPLDEEITADGRQWHFTGISMGNPHATVYVPDTAALELDKIGPLFEHHPRFAPDRVNTEFLTVRDRGHIDMRVWERGSGETMACGTGACAAAFSAILHGYTDNTVEISLLGGKLTLSLNPETGHIFMTGPATEVFTGEWPDR